MPFLRQRVPQGERVWSVWTAFLLLAAVVACQSCPAPEASEPELYGYEIVAEYPHDPYAFTQGLQFDTVCSSGAGAKCREVFWESTGLYGRSTMRMVDLDTGEVQRTVPMAREWFGEGAARLGNRLYQITWLTNQGFVYSVPQLEQVGTFTTPLSDGWGITADGKLLVLSDGSSKLTWVNPADGFSKVKSVTVTDANMTIGYLNELEYIGGEIWANIWQTDCIARICPQTGQVKAWLLMHGLAQSLARRNLARVDMDVLNGIAWDHQRQRLFITGKQWPRVFEVVPQPLDASDPANQLKRRSCFAKASPI